MQEQSVLAEGVGLAEPAFAVEHSVLAEGMGLAERAVRLSSLSSQRVWQSLPTEGVGLAEPAVPVAIAVTDKKYHNAEGGNSR